MAFLAIVDITTRCNLHCSFCRNSDRYSSTCEWGLGEFEALVGELAELGFRELNLSGGEPGAHKALVDLVSLAADADLDVSISTNGTVLAPSDFGRLKAAGLSRINVSIDGPQPLHDSIRGRGAFALAMDSVRAAYEAGLAVTVVTTVTPDALPDIHRLYQVLAEANYGSWSLRRVMPTSRLGMSRDDGIAYRQDVAALFEEVKRDGRIEVSLWDPAVACMDTDPADGGMGGCMAGIGLIHIDAYGRVSACPFMDCTYGEVGTAPLRDLLAAMEDQFEGFDRTAIGGRCGTCSYLRTCGGCRAESLGGPLGEDDLCPTRPY